MRVCDLYGWTTTNEELRNLVWQSFTGASNTKFALEDLFKELVADQKDSNMKGGRFQRYQQAIMGALRRAKDFSVPMVKLEQSDWEVPVVCPVSRCCATQGLFVPPPLTCRRTSAHAQGEALQPPEVGVRAEGHARPSIDLTHLMSSKYNSAASSMMNVRAVAAMIALDHANANCTSNHDMELYLQHAWRACLLGKGLCFSVKWIGDSCITVMSLGFHGWACLDCEIMSFIVHKNFFY